MEESRKEIVERIKESIKIPILEADDKADKDTEDLDLDNLKHCIKSGFDNGRKRAKDVATKRIYSGVHQHAQ